MGNSLETNYTNDFESIKHTDEEGREYWYARELQKVLQYSEWRKFERVILKAKRVCKISNMDVSDNFADVGKKVQMVSEVEIAQTDYKLTRYACYLIIQNADSRKKEVAIAKTYILLQTRKQELGVVDCDDISDISELATNIFLKSQIEQRIKRDNIQDENEIEEVCDEVEKKIRNTIKEFDEKMQKNIN